MGSGLCLEVQLLRISVKIGLLQLTQIPETRTFSHVPGTSLLQHSGKALSKYSGERRVQERREFRNSAFYDGVSGEN